MDGQHLIYFTDPMCSWCYGFSPVIAAVADAYGDRLPVRLVLGGLRPGTTEPMSQKARTEVRGHWAHVLEASGQPFGTSVLDTEGFIYDTDPACRAVALARRESTALGLALLHQAHIAFYVCGLDVTDRDVLAGLAQEVGLDRDDFRAGLDDETLSEETWRDYAISQRAGVTGFPTVIVGPNPDGTFAMVTRGFQPSGPVLAAIESWLRARA